MKEITRKSRSRRYFVPHTLAKSRGSNCIVTYGCPTYSNDEKRWGRELAITTDQFVLRLNGKGINAIKSVLRKVGEICE